MKNHIIIALITIIFGALLFLLSYNFVLTGQSINTDHYTYTTAICNENNECQDVLIECRDNEVKSLTPISNVVKFSDDWKDIRETKEFCS